MMSLPVEAEETITREHIQQVIDVTDAAARQHDAAGIGEHLSANFVKIIEFPHKKWMVKVRVDKEKYLGLIAEGWPTIAAIVWAPSTMIRSRRCASARSHSSCSVVAWKADRYR